MVLTRACAGRLVVALAFCCVSQARDVCAHAQTQAAIKPSSPWHHSVVDASIAKDVEAAMARMSVAQKVGQLMFVGVSGLAINADMRRWISERHVGGVALFGRNVKNNEQIGTLTRDIVRLAADVPPFIAVDQEGGTVVRLRDGVVAMPGAMALGATRSTLLAYAAGHAVASDLLRLGFTMNLAPVLDVVTNPNNPVIGIRGFASAPQRVADLGGTFIGGQQDSGIISVAKHFPGHGDTQQDSHVALPISNSDRARLFHTELMPFVQAMALDVDAMMTAHIALPNVTHDFVPATVSPKILQSILRDDLGFDGVVITDGLEMQGIAEHLGVGKAAVLAILAGADMPLVLWAENAREAAYTALCHAVDDHTISTARLNQSVRRILLLKAKRHLLSVTEVLQTVGPEPPRVPPLAAQWRQKVMQRIADKSITLLNDPGHLLPLKADKGHRVLLLAPDGVLLERFARLPYVDTVAMSTSIKPASHNKIVKAAHAFIKDARIIVVAAQNRYHLDILAALRQQAPNRQTILLSMGSPFFSEAQAVDAHVCAFGYLPESQRALAAAVLGERPFAGRLPVDLPAPMR